MYIHKSTPLSPITQRSGTARTQCTVDQIHAIGSFSPTGSRESDYVSATPRLDPPCLLKPSSQVCQQDTLQSITVLPQVLYTVYCLLLVRRGLEAM